MLANSLCMSHLLFAVVIWGSKLLAVPTVRLSPYNSLAAQMQCAFLALLHWSLQVPHNTHLDLLHLLANQPPNGMLVAKQLVHYAQSPEHELNEADFQAPGHRPLCYAHFVWHVI